MVDRGDEGSSPDERRDSPFRYREDLRDFHRRSWELELFISGAVLFALFKLGGRLDGWYLELSLQLADRLHMAAFMGYYYAKLILYTLIVGFLVHLVARAFWVGLIGLDSAFPQGPRWERLDYGPAALAAYRRIVPRIPRMIVKTDVFASVVFSFTFSISFIFLLSIVFLGAVALLAAAIARFTPLSWGTALRVLFGVWIIVYGAPLLVDKLLGSRLDPEGIAFRGLRSWIGKTSFLMGVPVIGVTTFTLFSRVPKKWMYAVFFSSLTLVVGLFLVVDVWGRLGILRLDSHRFVPVDGEGRTAWTVDPTMYDEWRQRPEPRSMRPSIPGPVVRGSYLRVFVPLLPRWVDPWVESHCPDLEPLDAEEDREVEPQSGVEPSKIPARRVEAARKCLAEGFQILLDGRRVSTHDLLFGTHPDSGARGFVTFLDVQSLDRGRHELTVRRKTTEAEEKDRIYRIPFWR